MCLPALVAGCPPPPHGCAARALSPTPAPPAPLRVAGGCPPPLLGACKLQPAPALLHQASRIFGRHAAKRPPTTSRQQAPSCALDFLENFVAHDTPAAQPRSPRGAATGKNFSCRLVSLLNRRCSAPRSSRCVLSLSSVHPGRTCRAPLWRPCNFLSVMSKSNGHVARCSATRIRHSWLCTLSEV
ncbi:hypothetical protein R5R35_003352 [Gryllus longicercus]|uniref:Uncharacterized protein n=1 Tax=Gryllus longicercus TaxID=2509291 RepID=A0AAN9VDD4_9ORTH